jgi:dolichol-phosphate mannosyltransferase
MKEFSNTISIVLSVFNEEEGLTSFWSVLSNALSKLPDIRFEVIWVNDGSTDKTQAIIDQIVLIDGTTNIDHISIEFSKNYGHEAAMIAGIDNSNGEAIICMDSDSQHPPEKISEMINAFNVGAEIILMERDTREDNSILKNMLSSIFYKIINYLSVYKFQNNSSDFFLISKQVAEILKSSFRERNRFLRGFIQSIGFNKEVIKYKAPAREYGTSHYSYAKLVKLSFNAIFSFSNKPLRLSILASIIFIVFTLSLGIYSMIMFLFGDETPSGYTTIVIFLSLSFSILFVLITILSLYFEKTIEETRQRPIYIIKRRKETNPSVVINS